jgi:hypothetical protein
MYDILLMVDIYIYLNVYSKRKQRKKKGKKKGKKNKGRASLEFCEGNYSGAEEEGRVGEGIKAR